MFALTQLKSFRPPFSKGGEVKGAKPLSLSAESETLHRSKNAGEGEFLCKAKKEGEPSSGVLLYVLKIENRKLVCEHCLLSRRNINRHSFAFSFGCVGAKEKASQKEKRRFSGALPLLTPPPFEKGGPKLFLIALCEMYIAPDGFGRAMCVH